MTGVNKLSSCVAAFLFCGHGNVIAAAPASDFSQWSVTSGTITPTAPSTSTCPAGFTCATAVTGEGFFQRQITEATSGNDYFQTIITDKTPPPTSTLTFSDESYVSTGNVSGLADKTTMVESTSTLPLTDELSSADHIKAVWVGQDMSAISGVQQEFGFTAYEDLSNTSNFDLTSGATAAADSWGIDSACYSTPTGTDSSSGFIPASGSQNSGFSAGAMVSINTQTDFTPPIVTAPADTTTTVNGHANFFDLDPANGGLLPVVTDDQTDSFNFSASNNVMVGPLPPGRHSITWQARDNAGNEASAAQQIDILPTVNFQIDQITSEGKQVKVRVFLNGTAPEYPVQIPYTVSGTGTSGPLFSFDSPGATGDHDAIDGVININSGTIGQTIFYVANDAFEDADETVIFTMGTPSNAVAGQNTQHTVTITDTPQTLTLDFLIAQNNQITPLVTTDNGVIRVTAIPLNQNYWGVPSFDWSQSNSSLVSADCSQGSFYVDPTNLSAGLYRIHVHAAETGLPDHAASAEWWLRVGNAPTLNSAVDTDDDGVTDDIEGYQDDDNDGIPNYLDVVEPTHLIPGYWKGSYKSLEGKTLRNQHQAVNGAVGWSVTGTKEHINYPMLIATKPGLKLGASNVHLWNYEQTKRVAIDWNSLILFGAALSQEISSHDLVDPAFEPTDLSQNDDKQFMVSLDISLLARAGDSAQLVIPQTAAANSIEDYSRTVRSYTPSFGWQDFLTDNDNQISSALREGDFCPPPGASSYQPGLIDGFECLQLTLQDGGANDADGYRNGCISFHGGVLPIANSTPEPKIDFQAQTESSSDNNDSATESGGSGAVSLLFMAILLLIRRNGFKESSAARRH